MILFTVFILRTAQCGRQRELILQSILYIIKHGGKKYWSWYWTLWNTHRSNADLGIENCGRLRAVIMRWVFKILEVRITFIECCTPNNGINNLIYSIVNVNEEIVTCSNTVPCSEIVWMVDPFTSTPTMESELDDRATRVCYFARLWIEWSYFGGMERMKLYLYGMFVSMRLLFKLEIYVRIT